MKKIATTLFKHELHFLIEMFELKVHLPFYNRLRLKKEFPYKTQPEVFRAILEELGGAFLKLAQVMSLRPDLIGSNISKEFEKTLDHVPAEDFEKIKQVLDKNLPNHNQIFKNFNEVPIAAASIAQVHKAELKDGTKVAVKVQRPDIDIKFEQDIALMQLLAKKIKDSHKFEFFDPLELVEEFRKYTAKELDFRHETANMIRFRKNFSSSKSIVIPKAYTEYSNDKILVMQFLDGKNLYSIRDKLNIHDKKRIIKEISNMAFKQLFIDCLFHADLHPGNILFLKNKKIALIDYGIVGFIDRELKTKLTSLFIGLVNGDLEKTTNALIDLDIGTKEPNEEVLREGIYYTLGDYYDMPLEYMPMGKIFNQAIDTAIKSNLKMPANIILFGKSIITLEGFCRELYPKYNIVEFAKPFVKKLKLRELNPKKIIKDSLETALDIKNLLSRSPRYISSFFDSVKRIDHKADNFQRQFNSFQDELIKVSKILIYGLIIAAMFISSALLINMEPKYNNISIYSIVGVTIASFYGILITNAIRKGR